MTNVLLGEGRLEVILEQVIRLQSAGKVDIVGGSLFWPGPQGRCVRVTVYVCVRVLVRVCEGV